MAKVKYLIKDIKAVLKELKRTSTTDNVLFRNRILWKSVYIQRDIGDIIIHAEYYTKKTRLFDITIHDLEAMKSFTQLDKMELKMCGISKDLTQRTGYCTDIEGVLGSNFQIPTWHTNYEDPPIIRKLTKDKVRLVNDINGDWLFIQYIKVSEG